jgi:hypothetical protein
MAIPVETLPPEVRRACTRLREELATLPGLDLIALWAYGAMTRPDRPRVPGDVDTHGVLGDRPGPDTVRRIDELHDAIARDLRIEWDSWYILEGDARRAQPPRHAFREMYVDRSWSLHRAHWLAGEYVALHGSAPHDLVVPPTWSELLDGLRHELSFIQRQREEGRHDAPHAAYAVANTCRILYSMENRNVVVSKRAAGLWALDHAPVGWHAAIRCALRVHDGERADDDADILNSSVNAMIEAVRRRLG